MTGSHSSRWIAFCLCALLSALGCSTGTTDSDTGGSLSLDLTIADGVEIDTVSWEITGGDMEPMSGNINTSATGSTASVEVYGIPPGEDYMIEMTASSGDLTCRGSAFFDIAVGQVTEVHVMLNCKRPIRFGGVRVDGWFNICAELTKVVVSPLQTSVGNDIDLFSSAVDSDPKDSITTLWTATGGSIADANAAATTYTCGEAGPQTITVQVSDDDFIYCVSEWTVAVNCVPADGDLCEGVTCPDLGECMNNTCNPANGMCEASNVENGTSCDKDGMCMDGECVVGDLCEGVTCPDLGECKNNTCNPADGMCEESNVDNGTSCGDGGACMDGECIVDLCEGVTCPDTGNDCTISVCNMQTGECDVMDVPDGESCMDGAGTCVSGTCEVGNMCEGVNCDSGNPCVDGGTCNPSNGQCEGGGNEPIDTPCNDGGVCDGDGMCVACNDASQCSEDTNQCTMAACTDNECGQAPVMDGTVCDFDGTGDGVCEGGTCVAAPDCIDNMDCDDGNVCTTNTCVDGMCDTMPNDGASCDASGDPGLCEGGACVGLCEGVTCPDLGECMTNTCNPADGQCVASDVANGTACGDGGMCMDGQCEVGAQVIGPGSGTTGWNAQPKQATGCTFDTVSTTCTGCTISATGVPGGGSCAQFGAQVVGGCEVPGGVLNSQLALDVFVSLDASSTGDGNLTTDYTIVAENPALSTAAGLVTVDGAELFTAITSGVPDEVSNMLDPAVAGNLLGFFTGGTNTLVLDDEILPAVTAVAPTSSPNVDVNFSGNFLIGLTITASGTALNVDSSSCTFDNPAPNTGAPITFSVQ